jgi:regulatory protein YycI of two-component signal transduction system YycFG
MFFWFQIFLTWQFFFGKKLKKKKKNSRKNVNNKNIAKNLRSKISKKKGYF